MATSSSSRIMRANSGWYFRKKQQHRFKQSHEPEGGAAAVVRVCEKQCQCLRVHSTVENSPAAAAAALI